MVPPARPVVLLGLAEAVGVEASHESRLELAVLIEELAPAPPSRGIDGQGAHVDEPFQR